jgi:putative transposase
LIWGKKIWGRKRHALVDTEGNLMQVKVTAASDSDLTGAKQLLEPLKDLFPRLKLLWGDSHYGGTLIAWVKEQLGCDIHVVHRLGTASDASAMESTPSKPGFQPLPRRWVV